MTKHAFLLLLIVVTAIGCVSYDHDGFKRDVELTYESDTVIAGLTGESARDVVKWRRTVPVIAVFKPKDSVKTYRVETGEAGATFKRLVPPDKQDERQSRMGTKHPEHGDLNLVPETSPDSIKKYSAYDISLTTQMGYTMTQLGNVESLFTKKHNPQYGYVDFGKWALGLGGIAAVVAILAFALPSESSRGTSPRDLAVGIGIIVAGLYCIASLVFLLEGV